MSGDLKLTLADGKMGTLDKDVHGKVEFVGTKPNGATLALAKGVKVSAVDFTAVPPATDKLKLALKGKNQIGTLSFVTTNNGLTVKSNGDANTENTIHFLQPAADATLKVEGIRSLVVRDGTKGVKWNAEVNNLTTFEVMGKDLLTGEVKVTLARSSILALPSGEFPNLELSAVNPANPATIEVDAATQDPVLKVKKIDVAAGKTLKMNRPKTWWKSLAAGDTVVLLKAEDVELNFTGKIEGDPADDVAAKIDWKGGEKALVLEAKGDLKVPELVAKVTASGNKRFVNVTVSNDVDVVAASWRAELLSVVAPGPVSVTLKAGATTKTAPFEVEVGVGFTSGTLRVYAKN